MWRLVENLWNFFELPVTTGTFPEGRGGDERGGRGVTERKSLDTDISYAPGRTVFCMVDYVAAMPVP